MIIIRPSEEFRDVGAAVFLQLQLPRKIKNNK